MGARKRMKYPERQSGKSQMIAEMRKLQRPKKEIRLMQLTKDEYSMSIDDVLEAIKEIKNLRSQLDKAFGVLESCGVPKERAVTVANGIMVYQQRIRKQIMEW